MSGLFVTLEGGEGAGKSTLMSGLARRLEGLGHTVTTTREPGGSPGAERLRDMVLHPPGGEAWPPESAALLMSAARRDHVEKLIMPALARGEMVICDRFSDSTWAYQGGPGGVADDILLQFEAIACRNCLPDLTILLDAAPSDLVGRRQGRGADRRDVFERADIAFHDRVRARFLARARREPGRFLIMDALERAEDLAARATEAVVSRLGRMAAE
jgi:dTMP kinase